MISKLTRPAAISAATLIFALSAQAQTEAIMLPFINNVRVHPDIRDVIISFTSTQKAPPLIEISKAAPAPDPQGILAFPANSGAFSRFVPGQDGKYSLDLGTLGEQLAVGTTYHFIINVFNDNRNDAARLREQVTGTFSTLPQMVKVIFTEIRILPHLLNVGEASHVFFFDANVDYTKLRTLRIGRFGNSRYYEPGRTQLGTGKEPVRFVKGINSIQGTEIVSQSSPDDLLIVVQGLQDYGYQPRGGSTKQSSRRTFAEQVTEREHAAPSDGPNGYGIYYNVARGNFDLSGYRLGPGENVSIPFTLSSKPLSLDRGHLDGYLAFEISGRIEVTRPAPAPIRAMGRVRVGSNDFNADGSGDILWHNAATGESQIWFMSGSSRIGRATILDGAQNPTSTARVSRLGSPTRIGPPWRIVGSRDFNGDGQTDVLWYNSSDGETQIWHMKGHAFSGRATVVDENGNPLRVGPPWSIVGSNDMNGDRTSDIIWHNSASRVTQIWQMKGHQVIGRATVLDENGSPLRVGLPWSIVGTNDFNGDRKPDIVWYNASSRVTQIWLMDGFRVIGRATVLDENGSAIDVGLPWRIMGTNDFNRDGSADILWYNESTGGLQIWLMKGSSILGRATVDADRDGGGARVGPPWSIMSH